MKRSKFSLSHYKLLTMDMGYLCPITWFEALPGDTIRQATSALIRVTPLLAPIMHPVKVRIHHFFVPNRLIWEDWEDFITGGPDGTSVPEHPYISMAGIAEHSLRDFLGVPVGSYSPNLEVNALPFRAYALIYNEFFRDEDLVSEVAFSTASGVDATTPSTTVQKVAWEKDYFTTARPWEQKGDEITIPLVGDAPVKGIGFSDQAYTSAGAPYTVYETGETGTVGYSSVKSNLSSTQFVEEDPDNTGFPNVRADLSAVSGININDLRLAVALQRYQENRGKYGSRYVEYLRMLGIRPSDARLQNPEYLGGGRQIIQFSEVLQTAEGTDPVGDMKGHGIGAMRTNRYMRFFEEHGIVMSLMSVVPKAIYANSLPRHWLRSVKEDYFTRELQHLGDQEITNKEVYADHTAPDEVFGYQSRYDEYRQMHSKIGGYFHNSMNHWHMARIHASDVALNQTYIEATPTKRTFADQSGPSLFVMANHSIQARRMISARAKSLTL